MTSSTTANWITAILYDHWRPLGANPPANEYAKEGQALAEMLKRGASAEDVAEFLRQAAKGYDARPVPEDRLAAVVAKVMRRPED